MTDHRALIKVLMELNSTHDRSVACFSPGLVGMFGSTALMNDFLSNIDQAFVNQSISEPLRSRARNLTRTFIPQIASLNSLSDLSAVAVSVDSLRAIRAEQGTRNDGVKMILAALTLILAEACTIR